MGEEHERQSREEMDAHLSSPEVRTADLCLTATIQYSRFDVTWHLMTPSLRLSYVMFFLDGVQHFPEWRDEVESRGDINELAVQLVLGPVEDRLWKLLADELAGVWQRDFGKWWDRRVVESRPRPVDVDHELVTFVDRAALPESRDAVAPPQNSLMVMVTIGDNGLHEVAGLERPSPRP